MELVLQALGEDAKDALGSMGDETPLAVLSAEYRLMSHYFRQNFSPSYHSGHQSLQGNRVMKLTTRLAICASDSAKAPHICHTLEIHCSHWVVEPFPVP